ALRNVTAIRLVRGSYGDGAWLSARIDHDVLAYQHVRLAMARAGKIKVDRGRVILTAGHVAPGAKYVAFYIDGGLRNITNSLPYSYSWDTEDSGDGEHLVEIRAEDEN